VTQGGHGGHGGQRASVQRRARRWHHGRLRPRGESRRCCNSRCCNSRYCSSRAWTSKASAPRLKPRRSPRGHLSGRPAHHGVAHAERRIATAPVISVTMLSPVAMLSPAPSRRLTHHTRAPRTSQHSPGRSRTSSKRLSGENRQRLGSDDRRVGRPGVDQVSRSLASDHPHPRGPCPHQDPRGPCPRGPCPHQDQ